VFWLQSGKKIHSVAVMETKLRGVKADIDFTFFRLALSLQIILINYTGWLNKPF